MKLHEAFNRSEFNILEIINDDDENPTNWVVEPVDFPTLKGEDGFFIVKAKNILPSEEIIDCYIDLTLAERISDYAYFYDGETIRYDYHHEFQGDIICAVPIEQYGDYELFYSKISPEVGINLLKNALSVSQQNPCIAEDLGYILRDEECYKESAEMFQISVDSEPSSYFIYGELAGCYKQIGDTEKAQYYSKLFNNE